MKGWVDLVTSHRMNGANAKDKWLCKGGEQNGMQTIYCTVKVKMAPETNLGTRLWPEHTAHTLSQATHPSHTSQTLTCCGVFLSDFYSHSSPSLKNIFNCPSPMGVWSHCPRPLLLTVLHPSAPCCFPLLPVASEGHYLFTMWTVLLLSTLFPLLMSMWPLEFCKACITIPTKLPGCTVLQRQGLETDCKDRQHLSFRSFWPSLDVFASFDSVWFESDCYTFLWGCLKSEGDNVYKLSAQKPGLWWAFSQQ